MDGQELLPPDRPEEADTNVGEVAHALDAMAVFLNGILPGDEVFKLVSVRLKCTIRVQWSDGIATRSQREFYHEAR